MDAAARERYPQAMDDFHPALRLRLDSAALESNWRWLARQSGAAACGAAVKADGYGLGAREVMQRLARVGCRDFFVSTWAEAAALMPLAEGLSLSVFHGVRENDMAYAVDCPARPVLNSLAQVDRWLAHCPDRPCDVMIDTGINRLGLAAGDIGDDRVGRLAIDTLMSHLACADEDSAMNARQRDRFAAAATRFPGARASLANSAGICLGADYAFDLTRPGLALYGGLPRREARGAIRPVACPETQLLQFRSLTAGETVGYGATFTAPAAMTIGIVNAGYADGLYRPLGSAMTLSYRDERCAIVGRISMDLIAIELPGDAVEGDWVAIDFDLATLAAATPMSQYELLTGLGQRWDRTWF
jgi:alanine racemase